MRTLLYVRIFWFATALLISGSLHAASFPIGESGKVYKPRAVLKAFSDGLSLAPGQYQFSLNLSGIVWQEGNDSHGWEPTDQIVVRAFLNGTRIAEIVEQGLNGQNQKFTIALSLDFMVEDESKMQIEAFADVSSKRERWKVLSGDLNGAPFLPVPILNSFSLLAFGLLALVGLKRKRG